MTSEVFIIDVIQHREVKFLRKEHEQLIWKI